MKRCNPDREPLIAQHRQNLLAELRRNREVIFTQVAERELFRKIAEKIFNQNHYYDYFAPKQSGIGDCIIALDALQELENSYAIKLGYVHSHQKALGTIFKLKSYTDRNHLTKNLKFFVYGSFDFDVLKDEVVFYVKNNIDVIIAGMNIIIFSDRGVISVCHYDTGMYPFGYYNMSDFINNRADPFFDYPLERNSPGKLDPVTILINPFGSEKIRTLPVSFVYNLVTNISHIRSDTHIIILTGFKNNVHHLIWRSKLVSKLFLNKHDKKNILLQQYTTFKNLFTTLKERNVQLGISIDTSIPHLFNYLNIKNIPIFNLEKINVSDRNALFTKSPLGFSQYGNTQFPAMVIDSDWDRLTKGILGFMDYCSGTTTDTHWAKDLYDPTYLISQMDPPDDYIIEVNKKMDPLYKIQNH